MLPALPSSKGTEPGGPAVPGIDFGFPCWGGSLEPSVCPQRPTCARLATRWGARSPGQGVAVGRRLAVAKKWFHDNPASVY